jgi:hypothetical protein
MNSSGPAVEAASALGPPCSLIERFLPFPPQQGGLGAVVRLGRLIESGGAFGQGHAASSQLRRGFALPELRLAAAARSAVRLDSAGEASKA